MGGRVCESIWVLGDWKKAGLIILLDLKGMTIISALPPSLLPLTHYLMFSPLP